MTPRLGHFRRPVSGRRRPRAGRSLLRLAAVAAVIALAAPAQAQQAPGATYGPVQRADTLWELALRFRGEARVNARQAMIAILRANPEAFGDGNINALRSGVTLRVPTAAEMEAITPDEAAAEFARHDEAWRNRGRTGSAAPGGAPRAPPQPAPPAAEEAAEEDGDGAQDELRKARETVADLRERLAERDEAIEELLVKLGAAQRELRSLRAEAPEPAPSGESGAPEREASEGEGAAPPAAGWLPVSPLVLGSSLIVLLVLVVVVTLLRQRGEAEDALAEEDFEEEGGEDPDGETHEGEPHAMEAEAEPRDDRAARGAPAREGAGAPGSSRSAAALAAAAGASATGAGAAEREPAPGEGGVMEAREGAGEGEEADDLPIGIDLDAEEEWAPPLDGSDPEARRGFGGDVEVGDLDDLDDLDDGEADPAADPPEEASVGLGEDGDPPEGGPGPGRRKRGPRK